VQVQEQVEVQVQHVREGRSAGRPPSDSTRIHVAVRDSPHALHECWYWCVARIAAAFTAVPILRQKVDTCFTAADSRAFSVRVFTRTPA
jgi:hypothetical protein